MTLQEIDCIEELIRATIMEELARCNIVHVDSETKENLMNRRINARAELRDLAEDA